MRGNRLIFVNAEWVRIIIVKYVSKSFNFVNNNNESYFVKLIKS